MVNLNSLNDMQKKAVLQKDGAVLILAGAGSGKTTVLVNRIAYIMETENIHPYNILAITFTNKAANEMRERIENIIGDISKEMWISTFHAACVRILRSHIALAGYEPGFVIYDTADMKTVMKECYKELDIDDKNYPVKSVISIISKAKDNMQTPEIFKSVYSNDYRMSRIAQIYELYQKKLKSNNALDFDDILFLAVKILSENPMVLEKYQDLFRYIMVDEYQDTNNIQYMLISMLAQKHGNICVVGDDDQSIYKFRGANIQNILNFEKEFSDAEVIKLEQNYRSTQNILDAANAVIHNNRERKSKALWTQQEKGEKITLYTGTDERSEARYISGEIEKLHKKGLSYSDTAILYRTNAQSRVLEEIFMRNAIPYKIVGGQRFYDRKEIKDIIAYLRLIHNPNDNLSLQRVINEPKRGIGKGTVDKLSEISSDFDISMFEVADEGHKYESLSRAAVNLRDFCDIIKNLKKLSETLGIKEFTERVLNDTGYSAALLQENTIESKTRIDNLGEFISAVAEYEKNDEHPSLAGFLEGISLVSDIDSYDEEEDTCVLMTIHSAKGLEFPAVFIAGMEDGLFPSARSIDTAEDLEEERRLCYVAVTRAKKKLYITNVRSRTQYGQTTVQVRSRFLNEIPQELLSEEEDKKFAYAGSFVSQIPKALHKKPTNVYIKSSQESETKKFDTDLRAGDRVRHKKFGDGTVSAVQKFEKDAMVEIIFDSGETKRLMAVFAKLEKI